MCIRDSIQSGAAYQQRQMPPGSDIPNVLPCQRGEIRHAEGLFPVSYTHLDVYKRQLPADVEPQNAEDLRVEIADRLLKGSRDALNEHTECCLLYTSRCV